METKIQSLVQLRTKHNKLRGPENYSDRNVESCPRRRSRSMKLSAWKLREAEKGGGQGREETGVVRSEQFTKILIDSQGLSTAQANPI